MTFTSLPAHIKKFPLTKMSGQQKFLMLSCFASKNNTTHIVTLPEIRKVWSHSLGAWSNTYYNRTLAADWIVDTEGGFTITDDGVEECENLIVQKTAPANGTQNSVGLHFFRKHQTNTFDAFIHHILELAVREVRIADPWINVAIFHRVLNTIPDGVKIHVISENLEKNIGAALRVFKAQHNGFTIKKYHDLHDRFIVVDNQGYFLGPSLKDAALKSPAIIDVLNPAESKKLKGFFDGLWAASKTLKY